SIGGGHIARCLALADELAERGHGCVFAVSAETAATMPSLAASGHDIEALSAGTTADLEPSLLAASWPQGCALLVVHHYGRDARFESACCPWAERILVIDDLADRPHDCDLLLDSTLGRAPADYASLCPKTCRMLLGPAYALLRPEFAAARSESLARRRAPSLS